MTLIVLAIGIKLAHWGCYVPECNYRLSQGPWGRAIGQWIPGNGRSTPSTTGRPTWRSSSAGPSASCTAPSSSITSAGPQCRFVLLQVSEFDNWPAHAPPLTRVARFQDQSGEERILARTPGILPVPGQNPLASPAHASAAGPAHVGRMTHHRSKTSVRLHDCNCRHFFPEDRHELSQASYSLVTMESASKRRDGPIALFPGIRQSHRDGIRAGRAYLDSENSDALPGPRGLERDEAQIG